MVFVLSNYDEFWGQNAVTIYIAALLYIITLTYILER